LTILNTSIANVTQNSLVRGITLDTGGGSLHESIVGVTQCTNQYAGSVGTHLILLTILNISKANIIQNRLGRGITLDTGRGIVSESIGSNTQRTN